MPLKTAMQSQTCQMGKGRLQSKEASEAPSSGSSGWRLNATITAASSALSTVERGSLGVGLHLLHSGPLAPFLHSFLVDAQFLPQRRGRSFRSLLLLLGWRAWSWQERIAPLNRGDKQRRSACYLSAANPYDTALKSSFCRINAGKSAARSSVLQARAASREAPYPCAAPRCSHAGAA